MSGISKLLAAAVVVTTISLEAVDCLRQQRHRNRIQLKYGGRQDEQLRVSKLNNNRYVSYSIV